MDNVDRIIYLNEETEIVLLKEIQSPEIGLSAALRYHDALRPLIPVKRKQEQVIVLRCTECGDIHRIDSVYRGFKEYWNAN